MSREKELARKLTYHSDKRMENLRALSVAERSAVFEQLSPYVQQSILRELKDYEIIDMLDNLDMRQAEKILARVSDVKNVKISFDD